MLSFPFLVWVRMTFAIIPVMFLSEFELAPNIVITLLFLPQQSPPLDLATLMSASDKSPCNNMLRLYSTYIADSREESKEDEVANMADTKVFTDGSGTEGRVGAVAVLYRRGRRTMGLRYSDSQN